MLQIIVFFLMGLPLFLFPLLSHSLVHDLIYSHFFKQFLGNITIQGLLKDLSTSYNAKIWLKSDNLVIKAQQSLSIQNVTIIGLDMTVANILSSNNNNCSALPNPSECSCLSQSPYTFNEPSLYNSSSLCYIKKSSVPANLNVFLGFIQIGLLLLFSWFKVSYILI